MRDQVIEFAERIIPDGMRQTAAAVERKFFWRRKPKITEYQGNSRGALGACIAYNKFGGYCIPLSSRHRRASQAVLAGRVWEPDTIQYVMSNCGNQYVIHAGTYFGDFLPALAASAAKVWAFESNPENYRCASITLELNGIDNVSLTPGALGNRSGTGSLVASGAAGEASGGGSRILTEAENGSMSRIRDAIPVQIVALDDTVPPDRKVAILQLDVEGNEQETLDGALATVRRWRPILILESMPSESWLAENLWPLGHRVEKPLHKNSVLVPSNSTGHAD